MVARTSRRAEPVQTIVPAAEAETDLNFGFLADSIGFHLRLAQDASSRTLARHADQLLMKPGRFSALAMIHLNAGISQSALGRAIGRDKSTVSPLVKDLEASGYVTRKASVQDRRSITLVLTKKGERALGKMMVRVDEHEQELDRIAGASKGRLLALLGRIAARIV